MAPILPTAPPKTQYFLCRLANCYTVALKFFAMLQFQNKILFVGYGAVAQCALPILFKHLQTPAKNVTVMDFEDRKALLAPWIKRGVKFVRQRVTRENLGPLLGKHAGAGDLIIDLAWNIDATTMACCISTPPWNCGIPTRIPSTPRRSA